MKPLTRSIKTKPAILIAISALCLLGIPARAINPGPPQVVSSLFVPIDGDINEPGTTNTIHLSGEVHVVTHVTVSDTGVPSVGIWANLVHVTGTSAVTGITYLGVGAQNVNWVGVNPGPPTIPEQDFSFVLISVETSPGPPTVPPSPVLPVFLRNFVFGAEDTNQGQLQSLETGFSQ